MNNDNLKFRVWDTENECYQQDDADETFIRHNGTLLCVFWGDCDTIPTEYVEQEKAIIEFCIGLKDKNGNLVFEGDVLKIDDGYLVVCWDNHMASFMFSALDGDGDLKTTIFDSVICEAEIVGNIHKGILKK